ncbi:Ubiquitin carboxyl-terminal hydrolase 12 [Raphanus sativus]|nr:Ubiquitin carboxyl-terminal hydrolase 12 [Raphanus sativus]
MTDTGGALASRCRTENTLRCFTTRSTRSLDRISKCKTLGSPFSLVIHEGETFEEIKNRIQKKLHVSDVDFAKWKFAFMSMGRPEYLQDSDVVYNLFQRRDVYGAFEQYLGLVEHTDTSPKRAYTANQNRHAYEKPVKIYN